MYCYHCGLKIDEHQIEQHQSSFQKIGEVEVANDAKVGYICPRCGHLIHEGMSYEDSKALSRASHAQIQRGNNSFATGMCLNIIGVILLIVSIIFLLLSNKPTEGWVFNCGEFYVSVGTFAISVILLSFGITKTVKGIITK